MKRPLSFLLWLLPAVLLAACGAPPPAPPPPENDTGPRTQTVTVGSFGWHTAIIVPREALAATGLVPEIEDFPDAAWIEFGWGDRVYYPSEEKSMSLALGAAMSPSPAVMHIAGLAVPPRQAYADPDMVDLKLTEAGFRNMLAAIDADFERPDGARRAETVSRGLYGDSWFYNAHGEFHLFNTCNTWTARMLHAGGADVSPENVVQAGTVMRQARRAAAAQ